jgi:hypothetical protein
MFKTIRLLNVELRLAVSGCIGLALLGIINQGASAQAPQPSSTPQTPQAQPVTVTGAPIPPELSGKARSHNERGGGNRDHGY